MLDDRVLELFADGHTIVLQALHRLWPPLIDFAAQLTAELGHPAQINAYITPASAQGFGAHYDVHDVFILQIDGRKQWIVHEPVFLHPLRTQPWGDHRDAVAGRTREGSAIDTVLEPGDVLYLPRGYIHSAKALGGTCIHLTVGVQPYTRQTLVEAIAALAADDHLLRRSLPLGIDITDAGDLEQETDATVEALIEGLRRIGAADLAPVLERRTRAATRPAPLGPLAQAAALSTIDLDTVLEPRGHLRIAIETGENDVAVMLSGRRVSFPPELHAALSELLEDRRPLRLGDLDGLSEEDALVVGRRLVQSGLAVLALDTQ